MKKWLASASVKAVLVVLAGWLLVALVRPALIAWAVEPLEGPRSEGRIEVVEHLFLVACLGGWLVIATRVRRRGRALAISVVLVLQMLLLLGEELDWGAELGLPTLFRSRNLRVTLRETGVLPRALDALPMVAIMLAFVLSPLVPSARFRAFWEGAMPVRAEVEDGIATLLVLAVFLPFRVLSPQLASIELLQSCEYLVLGIVTLRVLRRTKSP